MSVASTRPDGPTCRAIRSVCSPAPAATSRTRDPSPIRASPIISVVDASSHRPITSPQRCQASAASCHCRRVVCLNTTGSKVACAVIVLLLSSCPAGAAGCHELSDDVDRRH